MLTIMNNHTISMKEWGMDSCNQQLNPFLLNTEINACSTNIENSKVSLSIDIGYLIDAPSFEPPR